MKDGFSSSQGEEGAIAEASMLRLRMADNAVRHLELTSASEIPFEETRPFRNFPTHRKQRNMPGFYWFATTRRHIPYESLLEMNVLLMLDFDPKVLDVFAQPFELVFPGTESSPKSSSNKKPLRHVPDFLARRSVGRNRVIDVKPARSAEKPKVQRVFDLTREVCEEAGWGYEVMAEPDPAVFANVEWLSGFRRSPTILEEVGAYVQGYTAGTLRMALGELVRTLAADCPKGFPEALYRPVVYHLLWKRVLTADLSVPLSDATVLRMRLADTSTTGVGTDVKGVNGGET